MSLTHVLRTAFNGLSSDVAVRRIILPDTIAEIATYAFSGLSSVDKLIVRSTNVTALTERSFFNGNNVYRLELALPSLLSANVGNGVMSNGNTKRLLCLDLTGFGEIPGNAFGGVAVSNLVLKTVLGQKIAASAFTSRDLRCVSFTGDRPDLSSRGDIPANRVFGGESDYAAAGSILFRVPYGNATYDDWRTEAAARPLNADELSLFRQKFPSEPDPIGWISGKTCGAACDQILGSFNPLTLDNTLVVSAPDGCADWPGIVGCRTVLGLDDGETWAVEMPETFVTNGVKYRTMGGTVKRPADGAAGWTAETFDGCAYTFIQRGDEGAQLTWRVEVAGYAAPSFATDSASYPEAVTAVPDREADTDGFYPVGTTWTLTIDGLRTQLPKSRFVRWVGDVPVGHECDLPLVLTPTNGAYSVRAEFQRDWLLTTVDGVSQLTDGVWTLRASKDGQGRVSIGNGWTAGGGYLAGPSVPTPLDLSGALTDADGNALSLHYIGNPAFKMVANISSLRIVSDTLTQIGSEAFYNLPDLGDVYLEIPACTTFGYSCFSTNPELTNLVVRADGLTTCAPTKPWRPFSDNPKLVCVEIRAPKLTYLTDYFLADTPLTATDFSTWDLASVERIGERAFKGCRVTDGLSLPALREVGNSAFYSAKVEALAFGTKYLTNICANAFIWCQNLRTVTLGNTANLKVDATAFLGDRPQESGSSAAPKHVTFLGPAPTQENIDSVIAAVSTSEGEKTCRIYASKGRNRRDGLPEWENLATTPSGEDEIAAAAAESVAQAAEGRSLLAGGVYRDGSRKAWLIRIKTPYDQKRFALIIR